MKKPPIIIHEDITDGGGMALSQGEDDTLRVSLFADDETFMWVEFDQDEVDSLIQQLIAWRDHRLIGLQS